MEYRLRAPVILECSRYNALPLPSTLPNQEDQQTPAAHLTRCQVGAFVTVGVTRLLG